MKSYISRKEIFSFIDFKFASQTQAMKCLTPIKGDLSIINEFKAKQFLTSLKVSACSDKENKNSTIYNNTILHIFP